jgi:hypothetical protein
MNRRRVVAATLLSLSIVAVLGVIVYVERVNATQTVTVFMARTDTPAGSGYDETTVQPASIRADEGTFAYQRQGPNSIHARFGNTLHAGDIVRGDDLVPLEEQVEVALTLTASPAIASGDTIDVYGTVNGTTVLLGQHLTATSGGATLTVLVPARDEAAWAAVVSSSTPFHAVKSSAATAPSTRSMTSDQAVRLLCGAGCRGLP